VKAREYEIARGAQGWSTLDVTGAIDEQGEVCKSQ
jgi:hypothetical protein